MRTVIESQRNIIDYALSGLMRRRGKTFSLILLYALVVFVLASIMFFTHAMRRESELLLSGAPELVVQRMIAGRHDPIPLEYGRGIATIRGVSRVQPRLWGYYYDSDIRANYTVQTTTDDSITRGTLAIGAGLARMRSLKKGDELSIWGYDGQPRTFQVATIFTVESDLLTTDLVLTHEADFRELFHFPMERATDLSVTVRNPREIPTVAARIAELYPDTRPITRQDILRTYAAVFDWRGGILIVMVSMALLAFVIFAWDRASGLSANEQREIGILKSIGWKTEEVLILKLWEGAIISLTAFLLGLIGGYIHVFLLSAPLFARVIKGWATLYPSFRLTPFIDYYQVAVLFVLSVFPYLLATVVPSWQAAIVDPDNAMRGSE